MDSHTLRHPQQLLYKNISQTILYFRKTKWAL